MVSAATLHRLHAEEPSSSFSAEARARILAEARANIAAPLPDMPVTKPEDVLAKWRREFNERDAMWAADREREDRKQQRHQQRQTDTAQAWSNFIAEQVRTAVENERSMMTEIVGVVIGEERRRIRDDLTKAFNTKLDKLRTEHAKQVSELAMTIAKLQR
jgi:hypothetical protein